LKIVTVIGARPQFIKAAAVSRAIAQYNSAIRDQQSTINEVIAHTGQHFDRNMSDVFFEEMQIPKPHYFLEINSMNHGAMTGRMLEKVEEVLLQEKPDYVLVYGDTNSTLAGALAAKKLHSKVVHVEAGLRSFNTRMPEEINRMLTDRLSDVLCCPTETAIKNLIREGFINIISSSQQPSIDDQPIVINTGDVMLDTALYYGAFSADRSTIVRNMNLMGKDFALCTIHRAENTDDPKRLTGIFAALHDIIKEMTVVLPLHPRTRKIAASMGLLSTTNYQQLLIIEPVGYFDMIELLKQTRIVLTDSGGLQKEAYFFKKPCVTMRDETEWVELIDNSFNILAGAEKTRIISAIQKMFSRPFDFSINLYGKGIASRCIVETLVEAYSNFPSRSVLITKEDT
jgi:UDP-GlcNAc3NAcA epimerase